MTVLLCILDGFGLREKTPDNAVAAAHKPVYDTLIASCPHTVLDGSGLAVGLPPGQMGNSEVGHLNLGAGRVVYQDITRIDSSIDSGKFFAIPALRGEFERAQKDGSAVHIYGLLSDGQVHSSMRHLFALLEMGKRFGLKRLFLHLCTDGRDTPPHSSLKYLSQLQERMDQLGVGRIATIGGRYYGMDRDKRWERTMKQFDASVNASGRQVDTAQEAIESSHREGITDEFILPAVVRQTDGIDTRISSGDTVIIFNFRADRVRQISWLLSGRKLDGMPDVRHPDITLLTMTSYDEQLTTASVLFPPTAMTSILGDVLSRAGKRQLRAAETEKYPHVTFFFNGGMEEPFSGEERLLVASPKVATYDLQPEMSSVELTERAVQELRSGRFDFVLLNYANPDMVGHTGVFLAARAAVEAADRGLGRLLAAVEAIGGVAIVTADHGNAEMMIDPETGGPWTAHTTNLVPCILYDPHEKVGAQGTISLRSAGVLADVAPTILEIFGLPQPDEMTGQSLLTRT